jgi:L-iditol 2-dehydrogenase
MRTVRLHAAGDLRLADEPVPAPGPGQTLVRVTVVGICGSDLHWFDEGGIGDARLDRPLVPGHELSGVIADGPRRGTRVAIDPALPCRACASCRSGHPNLCPAVQFAGHGDTDGGLRDYLAWPDAALHPLPPALSDTHGAMLEPLGVAIHAMDLAHARLGMAVAVVGCGPIGLMLVQLARASGATAVTATDPLAHRLDAAVAFGAAPVGPEPVGTGGGVETGVGADIVFEVSGTDGGLATALTLARPGGRVVLVGIPSDDRHTFPAALARRKGLTLTMVRRMGEVYPRAIALCASGAVDVTALVTDRYPLERAGEAFHQAASRTGVKTVIDLDPT